MNSQLRRGRNVQRQPLHEIDSQSETEVADEEKHVPQLCRLRRFRERLRLLAAVSDEGAAEATFSIQAVDERLLTSDSSSCSGKTLAVDGEAADTSVAVTVEVEAEASDATFSAGKNGPPGSTISGPSKIGQTGPCSDVRGCGM